MKGDKGEGALIGLPGPRGPAGPPGFDGLKGKSLKNWFYKSVILVSLIVNSMKYVKK